MTAALKMAAPGELSSQIKKANGVFAKTTLGIKAMKHHGVTERNLKGLNFSAKANMAPKQRYV